MSIKGTVSGTVANANGDFVLNTTQKPPFTIRVSAIVFLQKEIVVTNPETLNIALGESILEQNPTQISPFVMQNNLVKTSLSRSIYKR